MLLTKSVINMAMETTAACFLLMILAACLSQKKKDATMRALAAMVLAEILCLLCQIGQWHVLQQLGIGNTAVLPFGKALFAADFGLVCLLSSLLRTYILAHRENLREEAGFARQSHRRELISLFWWWIAVSAVFASSIRTGIFYVFDETEYGIFKPLYGLMFAVGLLPAVLNTVTTIKNRKLFGKRDTLFLLAFILAPTVGVALDLRSDLCISYLLSALIIVGIFLGINVKRMGAALKREAELARSREEMTNMRVNLMMAQIQPHFLYNTLSTISYLCTEDPKEAETATNEFADYLKANLRSINSRKPIPFAEELRHVENYLKIEKRRYTDRIRVAYDVRAEAFPIPALALQTMVENAVRYGAEARYEPTTVTVATRETERAFVVTVRDDGVGFDVSHTPEDDRLHIGIEGTRSRLASMVGGTLEIESRPGEGTTVTMTIPKESEGETA